MKSILLVKKHLRLVEMTSALENASLSLPEWQAVKMIFFATCQRFLFKPPFEDKKNSIYSTIIDGNWLLACPDFMPSRHQSIFPNIQD